MSTVAVGLKDLDRDHLTRWTELLGCSPPHPDETDDELRERLRALGREHSAQLAAEQAAAWRELAADR